MKSIPEIAVDLDAPAAERWIRPGKKIAGRVHALTESVLDLCSDSLPPFLQPLLYKKAAFASLVADPVIRIFLGPLFEECKGLSKITGIPAQLLAVSNCAYDASQFLTGYPTACSTGVFHDADGRPVMLRFMDWCFPEDIGRYTTVVHYHNSETEWTDEDGEEWMSDTHERFCEINRLAQEAEGFTRFPGLGRFEEEPVCNDYTVHLALMRPATGTLKFKNYAPRGR